MSFATLHALPASHASGIRHVHDADSTPLEASAFTLGAVLTLITPSTSASAAPQGVPSASLPRKGWLRCMPACVRPTSTSQALSPPRGGQTAGGASQLREWSGRVLANITGEPGAEARGIWTCAVDATGAPSPPIARVPPNALLAPPAADANAADLPLAKLASMPRVFVSRRAGAVAVAHAMPPLSVGVRPLVATDVVESNQGNASPWRALTTPGGADSQGGTWRALWTSDCGNALVGDVAQPGEPPRLYAMHRASPGAWMPVNVPLRRGVCHGVDRADAAGGFKRRVACVAARANAIALQRGLQKAHA